MVAHDICLRGIIAANDVDLARPNHFTWRERSIRTIVHEFGHFLGLDHEYEGLSALDSNLQELVDGDKEVIAAKKKTSMRLDCGSVMDSLSR